VLVIYSSLDAYLPVGTALFSARFIIPSENPEDERRIASGDGDFSKDGDGIRHFLRVANSVYPNGQSNQV